MTLEEMIRRPTPRDRIVSIAFDRKTYRWACGSYRAEVYRSTTRHWVFRVWDVIDKSIGGSGKGGSGLSGSMAGSKEAAIQLLADIAGVEPVVCDWPEPETTSDADER